MPSKLVELKIGRMQCIAVFANIQTKMGHDGVNEIIVPLYIILVWTTSWKPALGALFLCVCVYVSVCPRSCPHIVRHMNDYETQSGLICICGMERYIIKYTSYN